MNYSAPMRILLVTGCLLAACTGCAAGRRQQAQQKVIQLSTQVEVLEQRLNALERRLEQLEDRSNRGTP